MTVLDALREKLEKKVAVNRPAAAAAIATGCAPLDAALGGGLPRGRLVEVSGAWSSGKATLALAAAAKVTDSKRLAVYVDGRKELYPPAAAALGVELARLLVVRPERAGGSARAGEIAARSGAFPLVVLDLADGEVIDPAATGRLRAAAAASGAAVVALAPRAGALAQAPLKLETVNGGVIVHKGGVGAPGTRVPWKAAPDRGYGAVPSVELGGLVLRGGK